MVAHGGAGGGVGGGVRRQVEEAQASIILHGVASHVEVHPGLHPRVQRQHGGPGQQGVVLFEQHCEEEQFELYVDILLSFYI